MNELEIKKVPFMGTELMAARDKDGQIWAGAKWMCNGIGLTRGQANGEITKIQTDEVLKEGCMKFRAGAFDLNNDTIAIKLDFVPLWLAKISITPAMKQERPDLAATLKEYQLKAKGVLAAAFLPEKYRGGHTFEKPKPAKTESQLVAETKRATAMILNAKNRTAERFQKLWDRANVKPEYQALALGSLFAEDGVNLPRIALQSTKVTYDKGTIAEKLGVYSKASGGKTPHAQAIGAIIAQLDIDPDEREVTPYSRNGHDGVDEQFAESVVEKVHSWLEDRDWPVTISNGSKSFGVTYRKQLGEPGNG